MRFVKIKEPAVRQADDYLTGFARRGGEGRRRRKFVGGCYRVNGWSRVI